MLANASTAARKRPGVALHSSAVHILRLLKAAGAAKGARDSLELRIPVGVSPQPPNYWQAEVFLKERGVPLNYSASDLEADNATLDKILARS